MVRDGDGDREGIPAEILEVTDLFQQELQGVTFPDIDAGVLDDAIEKLQNAAKAVEQARLALETAKSDRDAAELSLRQNAKKALAYAKVYADGDELLVGKIAAIKLEKQKAARKPAKRRRRSKKTAQEPANTAATSEMSSAPELPFIEEMAAPIIEAG